MRITLNLATRPFADLGPALKRLRVGMGILALLAIALLFGLRALHQKAEQARARAHSLDGQIARITQEREGYQATMQRPENAKLLTQAEELNKLFDQKAFSWTLAMESLETVLPGGVQVSTLEPVRAKDGHITLHLRVAGPRDRSVELVRNLEHSRRFLEPRIVGENSDTTNGPNQRLEAVSASNRFTFDLLAEYNPPLPEENKPVASGRNKVADEESGAARPGPGSEGNRQAGRQLHSGLAPVTSPRTRPNPAHPFNAQPGGPQ